MYKKILFTVASILSVALLLWSCLARGIGPAGSNGMLLTWAKMNIEQRKEHMRNVVLPRAGAIFQEWRPSHDLPQLLVPQVKLGFRHFYFSIQVRLWHWRTVIQRTVRPERVVFHAPFFN